MPAERPLRRVASETPALAEAAQRMVTLQDREFFDRQSELIVMSRIEAHRQQAVQEIWTRSVKIIAQSVTLDNERQALREGLLWWLTTDIQPRHHGEDPKQRWLVTWFRNVLGEVLKAVVKEAVLELVLPGVHIIVPPTGLVDAIFAATHLLEFAEAA